MNEPKENLSKLTVRSAYNGIDVSVKFNTEKLREVQSCKIAEFPSDRGTLTFVDFCYGSDEEGPEYKRLLEQTGRLKIFASNEFGYTRVLFEETIKFDPWEISNFAIDDIVLEVKLGFTVLRDEH